jgi:hypothetical protein
MRRQLFARGEMLERRCLLTDTTPTIQMESITETNFQTLAVSYDVQSNASLGEFALSIYRAPTDNLNTQVDPLITTVSESGSNATPGQHTDVPVTISGGLEPNPGNPFVFAEATGPGGASNSVSFQKVVIGVVTHGFFVGLTPPQWVKTMAQSLRSEQFNDVIAFPWSYSWYGAKNVATKAGNVLAKEVEHVVESHIVPSGTVVDLELIGHSRGAVVVNQAFTKLEADSTKIPKLEGGYWREVLLDPHPANPQTDALFSYANTILGRATFAVASRLQADMQDPQLSVPSMVSEVQDYYEHTSVSVLGDSRGIPISTENVITPWGVPGSKLQLASGSNTMTHFEDLTAPGLGHTEVHEWYQEFVVPTLGTAQSFVTGPIDAPLLAENYLPVVWSKSIDGNTIVRFEDADPTSKSSDYSITIHWRDGGTSVGTAVPSRIGGFDVTGSHTYQRIGKYTATVQINDVGGSKLRLINTIVVI